MLTDFRHAVRALRRAPAYLLAAACTLALGVGVNTALFSVVDAVLLRPLPYRAPERLVRVWADRGASKGVARALAERTAGAFADVALVGTPVDATLATGRAAPALATVAPVSANLFALLGAPAALGRTFAPGEDARGRDRVVVLGDRVWRERFGADPAVVGRSVTLDGVPREVVGVMPPGFSTPATGAELWTPATVDATDVGDYWWMYSYQLVARLRDGVGREQALALGRAAVPGVRAAIPWDMSPEWGTPFTVEPLQTTLVGDVRRTLLALWAGVGLVLLAACVNVANLTLARATGRSRELALRGAVGGSRARLVRGLVAEQLVVGVAAGAVGVGVAALALRGLVALLPAALPRTEAIALDGRVLAFALAAALLTSVVAGLLPAVRATRPGLATLLADGARGGSVGRSRRRAADLLVAVQVGLAVLLAVGAGLLGRSVAGLLAVDTGFRREAAATLALTLPSFPGDSLVRGRAYYAAVLARVRALPGVRHAAVASALPIDAQPALNEGVLEIEAHPTPRGAAPPAFTQTLVTPEYPEALGIRLLRGRALADSDRDGAPAVALVDSLAAARYWPGEEPVGQRVRYVADTAWMTVVGVVSTVRRDSLNGLAEPSVYTPVAQSRVPSRARLVVRGDPRAVAHPAGLASLAAAARAVDPQTPVGRPAPLADVVAASAARARFTARLAALFALVALAVGAVGVYGVVAYQATARTRELGVRAALGATRPQLRRLVLADGGRLAAGGALLGVLAAVASTRLLAGLLYGVSPLDPGVLVGAPALLAAIALLASAIPAWRASRVDPTVALRAE